jgi:hypothetical protein
MILRPLVNRGYPFREDNPPFSPATLPGLGLWLDASAPGTLFQTSTFASAAVANTDPVGAWLDRSGNGRHALQATSTKRPLLDANLRVRFDGIDDLMALSGSAGDLLRNIRGATVFGVVSCALSQPARQRWFYASANLGSNSRFVVERFTSNNEQFVGRRLDADSLATVATPTQTYAGDTLTVVTALADYDHDTVQIYQNGVAGPGTTGFETGSSGQPISDTASVLVQIGAGSNVGYWVGSMAEIIAFPRTLAEHERLAVESYLRAKWGTA